MPISITHNDRVYLKGHTWMEYARSMLAFNHNCSFHREQQLNQATHYLDGSMIYGSTSEEADKARTLSAGLLRTNQPTRTETLPLANTDYSDEYPRTCLPAFSVTLDALRISCEMNLRLWDETVAEIQLITYSELVPGLLGEKLAKEINEGAYNPSVFAEVNNEVALAVFRFFISLVQRKIKDEIRECFEILATQINVR